MRAAQETCSRAGSIIVAIIHIGPAIAATAGIARSVNIPRGSRTASSAKQVELTGRVGTLTLWPFATEAAAVLSAADILHTSG